MSTHSRGRFLSDGAKGGLALVVGGSVLAATATTAVGSDASGPAPGDVEIATLAATAELLAIDFYGKAIDTGFFKADVLAYMQSAADSEQAHYDALAGVLGADAPKNVPFQYPDGTFANAQNIADTGAALETAFVGAYLGAVDALESDDLKAVAAQVGANEAQHLTTLNRLAAGNKLVPNPSFPEGITAAEATMAVTPFLA